MQGNPMMSLFLKLKNLKTCLRNLNKDCYNNISTRVKQKKTELEQIQLSTLNRTSSIEFELIIQSELSSLEHAENMFLKQMAKIQWLKESDKFSIYFHSVIASKNKRETIRVLVNDQDNRLKDFDDMAFEFGLMPVRYMGVLFVSRKLTAKDCSPLIDKIRSRIHQWSGRHLSYSRRINQLFSRYLWKGSDTSASGARVSWGNLCKSKSEGGLGLKDLKSWNKVCMILLIQNLLAGQGSLWIAWTHSYVIISNDFSQMSTTASSSYIFKKLLKLKTETIPILNAGITNAKGIWEEVRTKHDKVPWKKLIWFPLHIPKFNIISWLAIHDRLPTRERFLRMGLTTTSQCILCNDAFETRNHLFADCTMVTSLWNDILNLSHLSIPHMSWENKLARASSTWKGKSLLTSIMKIAWCAFTYKGSQDYLAKANDSNEKMIKIWKEIVDFHGKMVLLENYSALNYTGLVKILKKYDKRTGALILLPFIQRVLQQPFCTVGLLYKLLKEYEAMLEQVFPKNEKPASTEAQNVDSLYMKSTISALRALKEIRSGSSTVSVFLLPPLQINRLDETWKMSLADLQSSS
ncbi:SPX domain-containing protein 1 [Hibiscus syriacus]|uniref:SPX domain-containing protein 1 n=1 Tax=Hibiscus syriacus TaxID=106335 RepID=A0A6A2Z867_HIBSY|nr:SPX domain-containing protein 1 [Hibiscus syriacus]